LKIAILGGTGSEGTGLGLRWAAAGHEVIIGSRLADKGRQAAVDLRAMLPQAAIRGTDNLAAAEAADLVVLAVPYQAQEVTLAVVKDALLEKLLVTVVAPTGPTRSRVWRLPSGKSAAEEAQDQLGDRTRVVAAFQSIGAHHLVDLDHEMDYDVLVCGEKAADKQIVMQLCQDAGMRGINAGALQNASVAEGLAAVLIAVNVIYSVKSAGIRITGLA
jgi:NADPH-dependent F420 reductase